MSSIFKFETRDDRINRMHHDNPGRPIELCAAVVDGIWNKRREMIVSKIPDRFKEASVDDLGYMTQEILDAMGKVLAPKNKNDTVGLIFCGPAGSGKTHAAYALLKLLAERNPEMIAFMTGYSSAMSELKAEFSHNASDELGSMWDRLNNESGMYDGIIFIDDVSSQKLTDFEADRLMMIIENRVNSYMPFLLTTNVKPEKFIEIFGERLASRLVGYCEIVTFIERDHRADLTTEESYE